MDRWQARYRFDFEQESFLRQAAYFYEGARRRCLGVDVEVTYLPQNRQLCAIDNVHIQLHHMTKIGSDGGQSSFEVLKDLLRLESKITGADEVSGRIKRNLTRQIDRFTSHDGDNVRVTGSRCQVLRTEKAHMLRWCHTTSPFSWYTAGTLGASRWSDRGLLVTA